MPAEYLEMKKEFMSQGLSKKMAMEKAAKIWNSQHPGDPVSSYDEEYGTIKHWKEANHSNEHAGFKTR